MKIWLISITLGCVSIGPIQATNTSLSCFQCDSITSPNSCPIPNNGTNSVNITLTISQHPFCFSEFLNFTSPSSINKTGIYRGVRVATQYQYSHLCSFELPQNVTRISCGVCSTSNCNNHIFDAAGHIMYVGSGVGSGGGSASGGQGNSWGRPGGGKSAGDTEAMTPSIIIISSMIMFLMRSLFF